MAKARKAARGAEKTTRKDAHKPTRKGARGAAKAARKKARAAKKGAGKRKGGFHPFQAIGKAVDGVSEFLASAADDVGERLHKNTVRVWAVTDKFTSRYPERSHPRWGGEPKIGVCFSGGGTRSAAASLGQMRALAKLGLVGKIDIVGAISGGSWFAIPWTYLPKGTSESSFLGSHVAPEDCRRAWFDLDRRSGERSVFAWSIANSRILFDAWSVGTLSWNSALSVFQLRNKPDDETWGKVLGRIFLRPLGLQHLKQRFLTGTSKDRQAILSRNEHLERDDFDIVERPRPFLVVGGTVINWNLLAKLKRVFGREGPPIYPIEITPLYIGCNCHYAGSQTSGAAEFGGGFLEPIGFDSPAPKGELDGHATETRTRRKSNRLSVQDAMAISGAAPAWYAAQLSTLASLTKSVTPKLTSAVKALANALPEYLYWDIERGERVHARNRKFGDGGFSDNLGIIPLLKRRVRRIVAFVNTEERLGNGAYEIYSAITLLFGREGGIQGPLLERGRNHVLASRGDQPRGTVGYAATVRGLQQAKLDGGPAVFAGRYRVVENAWHGVEGGFDVDIVWIYLDECRKWRRRLHEDAKAMLRHKSFENFPNYRTFFPKGGSLDIVQLTAPQVQLLANLAAWSVEEASANGLLRSIFG